MLGCRNHLRKAADTEVADSGKENRNGVMNPRCNRSDRWPCLLTVLIIVVTMIGQAGWSAGNGLERPTGLEPEIDFWRKVFAEVDSEHFLVHDDRHLGVIYETVEIPAKATAATRRRVADTVRARYRRILRTLATGKRDGLSAEEARVLALWPADVSDTELRRATHRIRLQQGLADRFAEGLVRSGQWQAYIRRVLQDEGVPAELAALPHVESSFNPEARSHVGAVGLWQFTRSTGRRFMQVDHVVDGRRDPYLSSEAAARLLSYNYSILKSWPLAITAYNHGVAGMRRAVRKTGTTDIATIVHEYDGRAFGFASRNFYVAFLAALDVQRNAERYFGKVQSLQPRAELMIKVPDYMPVSALADAFNVSLDTLREYNPALLGPVWSESKYVPRGFPLRLPAADLGDSAPRLMASVPSHQRHAEQTPDLYHRVRRGDSLSVIARRYHTSVSELVALNGLQSRHRIRAGQVLRLPFAGKPSAVSPLSADTERYVVRSGDSLSTIARRARVSEAELLAWNGIDDRNRIYAGQELRLRPPVSVEAPPGPSGSPAGESGAVVLADTRAQSVVLVAPSEIAAVPAAASVVAEDEADRTEPAATGLLADPADYLVAEDQSIEVQAAETLGHYADWLEIRTQRLRDINGFSFRQPVVIGRRLRLDFSKVSPDEFAARRIAYHQALQGEFFAHYRVADTTVHRLRRGESVWLLALQRYKVPVWLLRQYNPDLDIDRVRPGLPVVFPRLEPVDGVATNGGALADAS